MAGPERLTDGLLDRGIFQMRVARNVAFEPLTVLRHGQFRVKLCGVDGLVLYLEGLKRRAVTGSQIYGIGRQNRGPVFVSERAQNVSGRMPKISSPIPDSVKHNWNVPTSVFSRSLIISPPSARHMA